MRCRPRDGDKGLASVAFDRGSGLESESND